MAGNIAETALFNTAVTPSAAGLSVDPSSRRESRTFFDAVYMASEKTPLDWSGSHSGCHAGDTSVAYKEAILRRINFYRAMAGVPANVKFSAEYNAAAQEAALIMSANGEFNHDPSADRICYTELGAFGAINSNLGPGGPDRNPIDVYMQEYGEYNTQVAHRRGILYPNTRFMGTGDIPAVNGFSATNALWVNDEHLFDPLASTKLGVIAWPPPGYVPYSVIFGRWSFILPGMDFSQAFVTMEQNGKPIDVTHRTVLPTGYNGESGLVWQPMGVSDGHRWEKPADDIVFTVTIHNMYLNGVPYPPLSYPVILFDPAVSKVGPGDTDMGLANPIGAPGSTFTVEGNNYAAQETLQIQINGSIWETIQTDPRGSFAVHLPTAGVGTGVYRMTIVRTGIVAASSVDAAESAVISTYITVDSAASHQPPKKPENGATPIELPLADAFGGPIYLPTIRVQ